MSKQSIEVNTCDMGEDLGHTVTEVKIALPMSHNKGQGKLLGKDQKWTLVKLKSGHLGEILV